MVTFFVRLSKICNAMYVRCIGSAADDDRSENANSSQRVHIEFKAIGFIQFHPYPLGNETRFARSWSLRSRPFRRVSLISKHPSSHNFLSFGSEEDGCEALLPITGPELWRFGNLDEGCTKFGGKLKSMTNVNLSGCHQSEGADFLPKMGTLRNHGLHTFELVIDKGKISCFEENIMF
jgi:hypothetical protein